MARKTVWAIGAAALLCAGATAAAATNARSPAATPILPGYWETTNRATAVFSKTTTERRCITAAEVAKFMEGPSNRHYTCTYPTSVVGDGRMRMDGTCVSKGGRQVRVSATGAYTPTTLKMQADVKTQLKGVPVSGRLSTDARRLGPTCPSEPQA